MFDYRRVPRTQATGMTEMISLKRLGILDPSRWMCLKGGWKSDIPQKTSQFQVGKLWITSFGACPIILEQTQERQVHMHPPTFSFHWGIGQIQSRCCRRQIGPPQRRSQMGVCRNRHLRPRRHMKLCIYIYMCIYYILKYNIYIYIILYYIMLCYIILYYIILYYIILYYIILYYIILFILYYIIMYYTILYYIILYYIILY